MAFSTRRGRPRAAQPTDQPDPGTPELRFKHAHGLTAEPLDLCLRKQLITPLQHRCGLHLRWLHTVRYGAPRLTTRYEAHAAGLPRNTDDPKWRQQRETEYHAALAALRAGRYDVPLLQLCVDNIVPDFLSHTAVLRATRQPQLATALSQARLRLCHGLDLLAAHWQWH